jgi:hypothetical protein
MLNTHNVPDTGTGSGTVEMKNVIFEKFYPRLGGIRNQIPEPPNSNCFQEKNSEF